MTSHLYFSSLLDRSVPKARDAAHPKRVSALFVLTQNTLPTPGGTLTDARTGAAIDD